MRHTKVTGTILFSILFLFFLQSLSDFIQSIYAFGLLVTAVTGEVTAILLFFTPLLLLAFRKAPPRIFLLGLALAAMAARLIEPMLRPGGRLVACGISVGAFMLLFPLLLRGVRARGWQATNGLMLALSLSIFLRTVSSSVDLSESGILQIISWVLGMAAGILIWRADLSAGGELPAGRPASSARTIGLSIGLAAVILMLYFAFVSPVVMARWTGFSYPAIIVTLSVALALFAFLANMGRLPSRLTRGAILGWNLLFVLLLVLTILLHQIAFPHNQDAYPLEAPPAFPLTAVFLYLMLILSPILFLDFMLFIREISFEGPSLPQIGVSFTAAAFFFLLMVFFHVFTTVYDYIPIVGPLFRDRFWFVYLLAGLGMGLPVLLLRKECFVPKEQKDLSSFPLLAVGLLGFLSILAVFLTSARPVPSRAETSLKVMTYNIQQGFDKEGNKNLEGQLVVIRSVNPDLLGLQESDTARAANGNIDTVRYFADKLGMYSYYGPATTTGTFGIALLSKSPLQDPATLFLYSSGEQTAMIRAGIDKDGKTYHVFVTHLGNDGPMFQVEDVLAGLKGYGNVILMGDFNLQPATAQYALLTRMFEDSWRLKWPAGKEASGSLQEERIDYIFVSPGLNVLEAEYVTNPASDHPYLYTVIGP